LAGEIEGKSALHGRIGKRYQYFRQWDGKLEGDSLVGSWMSADGTITKPFTLKAVVQKPAAAPAHAAKKAASNTAKP